MDLPNNSIDMVYLFDFFHELKNPEPIINEIHRVLKNNAIFSLYDPMMKKNEIISKITNKNLFELISVGTKTCNFRKIYKIKGNIRPTADKREIKDFPQLLSATSFIPDVSRNMTFNKGF